MSRIVKSFTYGNGLTQADTVTLDYETARLLLQYTTAAVINRTHSRTNLLNLTGIVLLLCAADSHPQASPSDDRSAGPDARQHHELRLYGGEPAAVGDGAVEVAVVDLRWGRQSPELYWRCQFTRRDAPQALRRVTIGAPVAGATRTYAYPATSNKLTSVTQGVTLLHDDTGACPRAREARP